MEHFSVDCDGKANDDEGDGVVSIAGSQHCGMKCYGNAFNADSSIFQAWEVLLNPQADITVLRLEFLSNDRRARNFVRGHGGEKELTHTGELYGFPSVDAFGAKEVVANVLCMHDVEKDFEIVYLQGESFTVKLPNYDLVFYKKRKFYAADMHDWWTGKIKGLIFATVRGNEAKFTKKEVDRARKAQELIVNLGYSSLQDAKAIVNDGNITGIDITAKDLDIAHEIYGDVRPYVAGRRMQRTPTHHPVDRDLKLRQKTVTMHSDIMFFRNKRFFVCLSRPLCLLTIVPVKKSMTVEVLTEAMETHIFTLLSRGFIVTIVYLDPQRGFKGMGKQVKGVEIDISGAGVKHKLVDNYIRHTKEIMRSAFNGLAWQQPELLDEALAIYAVSRMNLRKSPITGVSPKLAFTGRRPSYRAELSTAYGDYVEGYNLEAKSNAVQDARTNSLIALYPTGNSTGSWVCYSVLSGKMVRCTNLKKW
jgi:hypothetical protein